MTDPAALAPTFDYIDRHFPALLEDVRAYLRIQSDSKTGEGIQAGAEATLQHLRRLGADARLVPTNGHPVVFGSLPAGTPTTRTLLVYYLYDTAAILPGGGQPWTLPPFGASVVNADAVDLPASWGQVVVNRAACNQKGPGIASLLGIEALLRATGEAPVNLLFVVEGEDEIGSPHLHEFTTAYEEVLRQAQGIYLPAARQGYLGGESMNISLGIKGDILLELECIGPTTDGRDLWCGHSALVDAPLWRLVRALNTLVDADDRVAIDGFYEHYRPPSTEQEAEYRHGLAGFDADLARRILNVSAFKQTKPLPDLLLDFLWGPQFNVDGLVSGWTGEGPEWTLPMRALAKCDIRLAPAMDKDDILAKLRRHLDRRGFDDVAIRVRAGYNWSTWPRDSLVVEAGIRAAGQLGIPVDVSPSSASCNALLYLGLPCLFTGPGHSGRYHCQDEYITVDGLKGIMSYTVALLHEYAAVDASPS